MLRHVTDYSLYRRRYLLGYSFMIIAVLVIMLIAFRFVPGELRQDELNATIKSASLSFTSITPDLVVNLPYHVLQHISINTFGVTTWSIKLPSLILAMLAIVGFFYLIRIWFHNNVAVLATILAATSAPFLFMLQDGTPSITYTTLAVWLLLSTTMVTRSKIFTTLWKVIVCVTIACLLYTPLGIYLVAAIVTTMIFHPHIRYVVKRLQAFKIVLAVVIGLIAITPVLYACTMSTTALHELLGFTSGPPLHIGKNALMAFEDLFAFSGASNGYIVRPLYSLGAFVLILIGVLGILTQKHTARSYVILAWTALLIPLIIINPSNVLALFVVMSILMTIGTATIIAKWYQLFPRNPYARVTGLIPLSIVILGIVTSGAVRYGNSYQYNTSILTHYSKDLTLLEQQLSVLPASVKTVRLITSPQEKDFYSVVARYNTRITLEASDNSMPLLVTRAAKVSSSVKVEPSLILTNSRFTDADRFYVYNLPQS